MRMGASRREQPAIVPTRATKLGERSDSQAITSPPDTPPPPPPPPSPPRIPHSQFLPSPSSYRESEGEARTAANAMTTASAEATQGRNILIALDYTDESVRTVKWALGQHVRDGDKVTLLHVTPEHTPAAHSLPGPGPFAALHEREQEQRRRRSAEEQRVSRRLHSWVHHYSPEGVSVNWETASVSPSAVAMAGDGGAARDCILSEAERMKADCLIVGSHRTSSDSTGSPSAAVAARGAWRSLSFGAAVPTSEYCAQHSPCPVIVVPPMPTPPDAAAFDVSCAAMAASVSNPMAPAFLDSLAL